MFCIDKSRTFAVHNKAQSDVMSVGMGSRPMTASKSSTKVV